VCKADNLAPSNAVFTKSGKLNLLEPSGALRGCSGTALVLPGKNMLLPSSYLVGLHISGSFIRPLFKTRVFTEAKYLPCQDQYSAATFMAKKLRIFFTSNLQSWLRAE